MTLRLAGIATFVSLPRLAAALEHIPPMRTYRSPPHLYIDHACLNLLESWQKLHEASGGHTHLDWDKLRGLSYKARKWPRHHEAHDARFPVSSWMDRVRPTQ